MTSDEKVHEWDALETIRRLRAIGENRDAEIVEALWAEVREYRKPRGLRAWIASLLTR